MWNRVRMAHSLIESFQSLCGILGLQFVFRIARYDHAWFVGGGKLVRCLNFRLPVFDYPSGRFIFSGRKFHLHKTVDWFGA